MTNNNYPHDLIGYGKSLPNVNWPGGAHVALQFVLSYEGDGGNYVLHDDADFEQFLSEITNAAIYPARHMSMEGIYEYGSHAGVWRILREFERRGLSLTIFGVSMAPQRHPDVTQAFVDLGHEIVCHSWRRIHYRNIGGTTECEHIYVGVGIIRGLTGNVPLGWYIGRDSPDTRRLAVEHGDFAYDADYYDDDLPPWTGVETSSGEHKPYLVVSYMLGTNDMRLANPQGFNTADHFCQYLKDTFDTLYEEDDLNGLAQPKMLSIDMHCRLLERPTRFHMSQRSLDYVQSHDKVWTCRRIDIARHWIRNHPYAKQPVLSTTV